MERWCEGGPGRTHFDLLASPGFLLGLSLLLLNDFVFKRYLQGAVSGKLSDFAGLFVFPLFWVAFFPRLRRAIYGLTAALFVFWKSSYSQPLIELWNSSAFFSVSRTVDYGDLMALFILPWSFHYSVRHSTPPRRRLWLYAIGIISIFAFAATSSRTVRPYDNQYSFQVSKHELVDRMSRLPTHKVYSAFWEADDFDVVFDRCFGQAKVTVSEIEKHAVVTLKEISYRCSNPPEKDEGRKFFEAEFIDKLNVSAITKSGRVEYIFGEQKKSSPATTSSPSPKRSRSVKPKS